MYTTMGKKKKRNAKTKFILEFIPKLLIDRSPNLWIPNAIVFPKIPMPKLFKLLSMSAANENRVTLSQTLIDT